MGVALLQMLGMSAGEAQRLASSIDWSSTLLLPVPQDVATFREVRVAGASALALSSVESARNLLVWQQEGVMFMLTGAESVEALVELAESVK